MSFRNVHHYDGKMEDQFTTKGYTDVEKRDMFQKLKVRLRHRDAKNMVELIIGGGNDDRENRIMACDVLAEICVRIQDAEHIMPFLEEQLVDNYCLGRCPQGRVWRLLQIYRAVVSMAEEVAIEKKVQDERQYLESLMNQGEYTPRAKKGYIARFLAHPEKDQRELLYAEIIEKNRKNQEKH